MEKFLVRLEQAGLTFALLLHFLFLFLSVYLMRELPPFIVWKPGYGPGLLGVGFVSMATLTLGGMISTYLFTRVFFTQGASAPALLGAWIGIPSAHVVIWILIMLGIELLTRTTVPVLQYLILIFIIFGYLVPFGWSAWLFKRFLR